MSAKKLVATMIRLHKSDDEMITLHKVLSGLYEMKVDCDNSRQIRRAIAITESKYNNKLKQLT